MRINVRARHGVLVFEPRDRLTDETEREFTGTVRAALDEGSRDLIVDLAEVPYLDSLGIGAIVHAYTSARRRGGNLKLVHVAGRNRRLLTVTRLLTVIEDYDTEDDAVRSFDRPPQAPPERHAWQSLSELRLDRELGALAGPR